MNTDEDLMLGLPVDHSIAAILQDVILPAGKLEKCKNESGDEWSSLEAQAAFLGPNIWEKSNEFGNDLQLGDQYVDLDEFLNASVLEDTSSQRRAASPPQLEAAESNAASMATDVTENTEKEEEDENEAAMDEDELSEPPSPAESSSSSNDSDDSYHPPPSKRTRGRGRGGGGGVASSDHPRARKLPADYLKPQPIVKKSRKQFVPDDLKDERYWARRRKNNLAAKRSRDARRDKENQIVVRAAFLEKENETLKQENERLKNENKKLKAELAKCKK